MHRSLLFIFSLFFCLFSLSGQNLQVSTLMNLNASGGVTFGPDGNVYVSDFGPALGSASSNTKVYQIEYGTWQLNEFATGFLGASGACFDSQGNFFQSNPSGGRVGKVTPDGTVDHNWVNSGLAGPIGITPDENDNLYVCNCGNNTIRRLTPSGQSTLFASSPLFNCPNGITRDPSGNLYACNFSDGRVLKITPDGAVSLFVTLPKYGGVANGHLTYKNGFIFIATIGGGEVYKLTLDGESEKIAGVYAGFSNNDGPALSATFSKPNGIAASSTGDTLFINCSVPTWPNNNNGLHPGIVRMVTGVCSLPDVDCPALTNIKNDLPTQNEQAILFANAPNPFTSNTLISYELMNTQQIELSIVNLEGKVIKTLVKEKQVTGIYQVDLQVNNWPSGTYELILKGDGYQLSRRLVLVK